MAKLITVVGATGIQGGSVIRAVLKDDTYTIRAITRNATSDKAKALIGQGVEVVEADLNDISSLKVAFANSYAIFAVTNFFEPFFVNGDVSAAMDLETRQGVNMATAALAVPTLRHYIWSTLPNSQRASNGRVTVPYYQSKAQVDDFISSKPELLAKTTFLWVSFYASNMHYPFFAPFTIPTATDSRKLYQVQGVPASTPMAVAGDVTVNVGLFAAAVLAQPEKTRAGTRVLVSTETVTSEELLAIWASVQERESEVLVLEPEAYLRIWPGAAALMHASASYWSVMEGKAFAEHKGVESVLGKDDLGVKGLVNSFEAFRRMQDVA